MTEPASKGMDNNMKVSQAALIRVAPTAREIPIDRRRRATVNATSPEMPAWLKSATANVVTSMSFASASDAAK